MEEFEPQESQSGATTLPMSPRRRWAVTAGVLMGMFLAALEMTIVGTAMPTVIAALGGLQHYSWVFSAYLITSTVTVPVWGKLSDLYGRRPLYQIGIALFLVGSILSGMSSSMTQLIIFRALQGLGAGVLMPLAMTIIGDIYTITERVRMQALFSGVWGVSSIVGPLAGGFITDHLSWRWVFFINIPFGLAAAVVLGIALQEPKRTSKPSIDYAGAATLMAAVTLLMVALVEGGGQISTLTSPRNLALLAAAAALGAWFVSIERRAPDPMLPLQLFRNSAVAAGSATSLLTGMALFGAISFVPLFAQGTLGSTATEAGSLLTPLLMSWVLLSIVGGRMLLRVGYRITAMIGVTLLTLGFAMLTGYSRGVPKMWLYADLVIMGAGLGLTMLTLLLAMQQAVPRHQLGVTTSLSQFARSIGGAIGVAVMGAVLASGLTNNLARLAHGAGAALSPGQAAALAANPNAVIEPAARAALSPAALHALEGALGGALHNVFQLCAAIAALALLVVWRLPAGHAAEAAGAAEAATGERQQPHEPGAVEAVAG